MSTRSPARDRLPSHLPADLTPKETRHEIRFGGPLISTSMLPGQENVQIGREDRDVTVRDKKSPVREDGAFCSGVAAA